MRVRVDESVDMGHGDTRPLVLKLRIAALFACRSLLAQFPVLGAASAGLDLSRAACAVSLSLAEQQSTLVVTPALTGSALPADLAAEGQAPQTIRLAGAASSPVLFPEGSLAVSSSRATATAAQTAAHACPRTQACDLADGRARQVCSGLARTCLSAEVRWPNPLELAASLLPCG